ncbi:hypothetical protein CY0110_16287 [Crocosphaera chwakensis CCY0110]|uniref:Uncharacterized protein n=1 Tax=Crocosphaera chwakensis CCY0110 TaxID=391612 RepID=A3IHT9_9CHRO|nr:hypothetical protein CY0110_16287 [Crocosphaera chwakensis CCY0110]
MASFSLSIACSGVSPCPTNPFSRHSETQ